MKLNYFNFYIIASVSYTHLDVYKRQKLHYRSYTLFDTLIQTHNLNLSAISLPPSTPTTHT